MECETNDCCREKRGCKGCFYDDYCNTADNMFKELGYVKEESDYSIRYIKNIFEDIVHRINFYKENKTINTYEKIDMQELQAINKKVEELGWK